MRMHSSLKLLYELPGAGLILLLSFLFFSSAGELGLSQFSETVAVLLSFFSAFFIASAAGMLFHRQSRKGAFFLIAVFLPFLYFLYLSEGLLEPSGLLLGVFAGGFLDWQALHNNRFGLLTGYARAGARLFFFALAVYTLVLVLELINPFSGAGPGGFPGSGTQRALDLGLVLLVLLALFWLTGHVRDIRISEVFIYGPSRSGKTFLLLALYNHFVNFYAGTHRETILSYDKLGKLSKAKEDRLRIESMLAEIEAGNMPESTGRTDMAMYMLSGKKGAVPIEFSFIDYSGEYTDDLYPEKYSEAVHNLDEKLERFNINTIYRRIGTMSFLEQLKKDYANELQGEFHDLILASIYKKMEEAGKIIFLVDGDHLLDYHLKGRMELTRLFGLYSRLMDLLGNEKSYAIVVTKIDKFWNLSEIPEDSAEAREIEENTYKLLSKIDTFREILHRARKVPIYFYTVSVDATLSPQLSKEGKMIEEQQRITQIFPWRVGEIAKFGF